jgi:hypothetical protein
VYLGANQNSILSGINFANNTFRTIKKEAGTTDWFCVYAPGMLKECQFIGNRWEKTDGAGGRFGNFMGGTGDNPTDGNRNVAFSGNLGVNVNNSGYFLSLGTANYNKNVANDDFNHINDVISEPHRNYNHYNLLGGDSLLMASSDSSTGHYANWQFMV